MSGSRRQMGSTLHVVHVTEVYGGVETYLQLLVDHSDRDSIRFSFVLAHENSFAANLRAGGFDVVVIPMPRTKWLLQEIHAAWRLRQELRRLRADVVHLHSSQAGLVGRLAQLGKLSRHGRTIYTPHAFHYLGQPRLSRWVYLSAERLLAKVSRCLIVATSPSEAARATDEVRVNLARVTTATNGVEILHRRPRELANPAQRLRVGMAARITWQKDVGTYLRAVSALRRCDESRFQFELVGTGHYPGDQISLDGAMMDSGLNSDDLRVTPWMGRPEFLEWLDSCDVVVLTSRYESFGYLLAEATTRGIPVIGTHVDGIQDIIQHDVNGALIPKGDAKALADQLVQLINPVTYHRLSQGALKVAAETLDVRRTVRQLTDAYGEAYRTRDFSRISGFPTKGSSTSASQPPAKQRTHP